MRLYKWSGGGCGLLPPADAPLDCKGTERRPSGEFLPSRPRDAHPGTQQGLFGAPQVVQNPGPDLARSCRAGSGKFLRSGDKCIFIHSKGIELPGSQTKSQRADRGTAEPRAIGKQLDCWETLRTRDRGPREAIREAFLT